jgi:hypothetical protein
MPYHDCLNQFTIKYKSGNYSMGINVAWDNEEKSICRVEFDGSFTWTEYDEAIDRLWNAIRAVDHKVDVIATMTPGTSLPKGLPLSHLQRAAQTQPENADLVVMVDYSPFVKAFIKMLARLNVNAAKSARFAPSVTEAHVLLAQEHKADQKGHV